jgi:hypothetical protein
MNQGTPEENYKTWRSMCEDAFGFLISEFDCSVSDEKSASLGAYYLHIKNKKAGIRIFFVPTRLEFGVSIGPADGKDDYDLLELVIVQGGKVRLPKTGFAQHLNRNETKEEVDADWDKTLRADDLYDEKRVKGALAEYAKLLRKYGTSVFEGDHSVFERIDKARLKGPILQF